MDGSEKERIETTSNSELGTAGDEFWSSGAGHVAAEVEKSVENEQRCDQSTPMGQAKLQGKSVGKVLSPDTGKGVEKGTDVDEPGALPGVVPNANRQKFTQEGREVEDAEVGAGAEGCCGGGVGKHERRVEAPDRAESGSAAMRQKEGNPVGTEPGGDAPRMDVGEQSDSHLGASLETSPKEVEKRGDKKDKPIDYSI
jgi:hypothetical protein